MIKYNKVILLILSTILVLSLFGCSKDTDNGSNSSNSDVSVDIVDISQVEKEEPTYFKNMEELIEAKASDEDELFERFENIQLVYFNDADYSLTQIGFYPEYNQVALRYTLENKFVSIIASKEAMPVETDAEVSETITICGENVDLYMIGLEQYWGQFDTDDMHIYIKFSIVEDLEAFEQLFEQSTLAEMMQANS